VQKLYDTVDDLRRELADANSAKTTSQSRTSRVVYTGQLRDDRTMLADTDRGPFQTDRRRDGRVSQSGHLGGHRDGQ